MKMHDDTFIEVEVSDDINSSWPLHRMFQPLRSPTPISKVFTTNPEGSDMMCAVTGWSGTGACSAWSALVDDSGEGVAMLIYGGDHGIRLKDVNSDEPWNLKSMNQWGEPCLLLDKDTEAE